MQRGGGVSGPRAGSFLRGCDHEPLRCHTGSIRLRLFCTSRLGCRHVEEGTAVSACAREWWTQATLVRRAARCPGGGPGSPLEPLPEVVGGPEKEGKAAVRAQVKPPASQGQPASP